MTGAIGFIGLGVMGEPICRNLARKGQRCSVSTAPTRRSSASPSPA
jgi:3-hydroxyisobutyrate dehydrogenase-like beta-hydroxyacid dehydrogenase